MTEVCQHDTKVHSERYVRSMLKEYITLVKDYKQGI